MKKLNLEEFKTKHYEKSELFNTNSIKGGSTTTSGHITNSTGSDVDSATADGDQDPPV